MPENTKPTSPTGGPAADTPLVRLVGVHKAFGPLEVLRGVDLELRRGQTTVVIGPSGTGKSVLLKHIVGLLRPDAGEVYFDGRRIDTLPERKLLDVRRRVGFLFQMGALFDSMTVLDNVTFPLVQHTRLSAAKRAERCERVLAMVGLSGVQKKMPAELSGGQRKRVALARAVVLEPDLLLYDEPTTGLDPIRSDVINELILALRRQLGVTSVAVTHDMASARKIADRMLMLYDGRLVADGDPESFARSDDDVVQRFIEGRADREDLELIQRGMAGVGRTAEATT